jgi:hypothetical protein
MVWTVCELRQHLDASGVAVPPLEEAGVTFAGAPAYACEVSGQDGFRIWYGLRELHAESGWWPVLTEAGARLARASRGSPQLLSDPVERGRGLDAECLLAARLVPQRCGEGAPEDRDHFTRLVDGLAADLAGTTNLDSVGGLHLAGLNRGRVTLLAVPARAGFEVPALLGWPGGWAYGIGGAEHYAILRHFHDLYGAELLTLDSGRMDLLIKDRPRTAQTVARAALELYAYCPDIVCRGAGTLPELARGQVLNNTWSLWWLAGMS